MIVNVAGPVPLSPFSSLRPEQISSGMRPLPRFAKAIMTATPPTKAPTTNDRVCWQAQRFVGRHFRHVVVADDDTSTSRLSVRILDAEAGACGGAAASVTRRVQIAISWKLFSMMKTLC